MTRKRTVGALALALLLLILGFTIREAMRPATLDDSAEQRHRSAADTADASHVRRGSGGEGSEGTDDDPTGDHDSNSREGSDEPEAATGEERPTDTEAEASSDPTDEASEPKRRPDDPPGYWPEFNARVVDANTGEPIAGARVMYGPLPTWWGGTTGEDGTIAFTIGRDQLRSKDPFRLKVTVRGYESWTGDVGGSSVKVELRPSNESDEAGRIRGRAEDADGRPLTGVIDIVLGDATTRLHWLTVLADDQGDFILDGVVPGTWRVWLSKGKPVEAYVQGGSDATVVLRAGGPLRKPRVPLSERRLTMVVDLADLDGEILIAESVDTPSIERWRATIRDGRAMLPALTPGPWRFQLLGEKRMWPIVEVPAGKGTVTLRLP